MTTLEAAGARSPGATEPVASVEDLSVTFRRGGAEIHAVRGVSLEIRRGEILGLAGESGSGKSVLGLSLLGLLPAQPKVAGRVAVCGQNMLTGSAELCRRVRRDHLGAVFQDPMTSLDPTMRVGRQLAEVAGSMPEAIRLLRAAGIPDAEARLGSYPHELSGGQRQRVMIAMAIAGNPSLVVADEPTTALDVTVQAQVLALLRSLTEEVGCGFLLITHDLGVAAQVADRVAVMYAGRLAEVGPARAVLGAPAHPYSAGLIGSRLSLATRRDRPLAALPGDLPDPAAPPPGCPFEPRCAVATDRCAQVLPEPTEVAAGQLSACILPPEKVAAMRQGDGGPPRGDSHASGGTGHRPGGTAGPGRPGPPAHRGAIATRVHHLAKSFPVTSQGRRVRLHAVWDVDLEVAPGESVAVVGESGSGKSTLLRLIAGLDRPDHGEVSGGTGDRPQMIFQDAGASLTPWLTVGELVAERLRGRRLSRGERRRRVAGALAQVGLPAEVTRAKAAQLSGGQRQRVALARATIIPPAVLLCDEPTSALDVSLAAGVVNLIAALRRELGMAVIFVTHDLSVARIVADRIAVMYLGRIVELGGAEDVVNRPRHPYTRSLVGAVPGFGAVPGSGAGPAGPPPTRGRQDAPGGVALAPRGEPASPLSPPPGCTFHPRCPVAERVCSDPDLELRLTGVAGSPHRLVACIRSEAI
ncbi:MAG TPA: ABC transporter ATP-binding protein [Streptosporangiaceae bacterium]|nr:ABC transporter ATP-binding protein [Streptosporangiaceae bacterium]